MEYPQRRYQIYLKSSAGPIEVFLVSQLDEADTYTNTYTGTMLMLSQG